MDVTRTIRYEGSEENLVILMQMLAEEGADVEFSGLVDGLQELDEEQAQEWQDLAEQHAQERRELDERQTPKRRELAEHHAPERRELAQRREREPNDGERNERERSELASGQAQERRELDEQQTGERRELAQRQTRERRELYERQSRERWEFPDSLEQEPEEHRSQAEVDHLQGLGTLITSDVNQLIVSLVSSGSLMAITAAVKKFGKRAPGSKIEVEDEAQNEGDDNPHAPHPA